MGRTRQGAILSILLLGLIVTLSGCAQVLGSIAGAAAGGLVRGVISSIGQNKAETPDAKPPEEAKITSAPSSQPEDGGELAKRIGDQSPGEKPVTYDIIGKLENKTIKFNKIIAVLNVTEKVNGNNNVVTKILDEIEVNKIIQVLTKCGVYDELHGNSLLNISFAVDGTKCTKVTYSFKYDNSYHTIIVGDQKISYQYAGSAAIDLDKKLSCNFLETIKKDISVGEKKIDDNES
jgi:hypothetical protein